MRANFSSSLARTVPREVAHICWHFEGTKYDRYHYGPRGNPNSNAQEVYSLLVAELKKGEQL